MRAATYLLLIVVGLAASEAFAAVVWKYSWWPLYPVAWLAVGTFFTSLFIITHDCGHQAFFQSRALNRFVGHLASAPLLYPFTQWSLWHDAHHRRTNLVGQTVADQVRTTIDLRRDTAFVPSIAGAPRRRDLAWAVYVLSRKAPPAAVYLIPLLLLFRIPYRGKHRRRCVVSALTVVAIASLLTTALVALTGSALAILHFWLVPLAVHATWLGYYAFTQHTSERAPVFDDDSWSRDEAQLLGTLNTQVPRVISILHSNSECHVVHHISTAIPSYHMAAANEALLKSPFARLIRVAPFSLRRFWRLTRSMHLWNSTTQRYVTFASAKSRHSSTPGRTR